jgi:hypothetical protein
MENLMHASASGTSITRHLGAAARIRAAIHAETASRTTTLTRYAGISLKLILTKAKARVANHIENAGVEGLDPFLLVIEDEYGDLVYTQGDLSFLMPAAPVLRQWFASQLNTEIQGEYDRRQLAIWEQFIRDGEQFEVAPNWNAAILPFVLEERQFTVTVFIPRMTN